MPLPAPQNFRINSATATNFTLAWDAVAGASKYQVRKMRPAIIQHAGGDMGAFQIVDFEILPPGTSVTIPANVGQIDYYRVNAVDSAGEVGHPSLVLKVDFQGTDTLEPQGLPQDAERQRRSLLYAYDRTAGKWRPVEVDPATGSIKVV